MNPVLVTGGAGYIGAHVCLRLAEAGYTPVAYDNLCSGKARFAQWGPLEVGDIRDGHRLQAVFAKHRPTAVLHLAGLIDVAQSVREPALFHEVNVEGSRVLLQAAAAAGVGGVVFSSSCATYGAPVRLPMDEDHPQAPISPYGASKLAVEAMLRELQAGGGPRHVALRYFNAAGADFAGRVGEAHEPETHVIPLAIAAARGERADFTIFGDDYGTRDGTAVRDYVHVLDLADAHVRALAHLRDGGASVALNLGSGLGVSVREVLAAVSAVAGRETPARIEPRRPGDPAALVADARRAGEVLGWRPRHDLAAIVGSAWRWHAAAGERLLG